MNVKTDWWSKFESVRFVVLVYRRGWREVSRPFSAMAAWQCYERAQGAKMLLNFGQFLAVSSEAEQVLQR